MQTFIGLTETSVLFNELLPCNPCWLQVRPCLKINHRYSESIAIYENEMQVMLAFLRVTGCRALRIAKCQFYIQYILSARLYEGC